MTKPKKEKKEKREIPLRPRGEVIQPLNRPSKVLFDLAEAEEKAASVTAAAAPPTTTTHHPLPPPTNQETITYPVSPTRDFTKVANSIVRDGVPSGLFKGTSKNTYDALYQRTRGAIQPTRKLKAVQSDLLRWANVSHNTLRAHLKHLEVVGLLKIHYRLGDNFGAEYEVFLPEEITPPYHPLPPPTATNQELGSPTSQKLVEGGRGLSAENIDSNDAPNTSLKTKNNIDDEFAPFVGVLRSLGKGKPNNWRKLGELLKREFLAAESYTDSVTDAPAFLTEHLKRKLEQPAKAKSAAKEKPFEPGKVEPATATFTPEPLSEKGRANVLDTLKRMPREQVASVEDQYTADDWQWLISRLN